MVDYHSKYPEVVQIQSTTSRSVIETLKQLFARHGIPNEVVSDNGLKFTSTEYTIFANTYGFKQIYSSPLYPRSNGQAERLTGV